MTSLLMSYYVTGNIPTWEYTKLYPPEDICKHARGIINKKIRWAEHAKRNQGDIGTYIIVDHINAAMGID